MEQVELSARKELRDPIQAVLGESTEPLFQKVDAVYKPVYLTIAQKVGAQSNRPSGPAQFETFSAAFGLLATYQSVAV